jgi:hypothetical protein
VFLLLANWRLLWYTIASQLFLVTHHHHSCKKLFVVANNLSSMLFKGVHHASNIGHQIFVLGNWEVAFAFKFHLSFNGPPTSKKEVLTSFALITCNVVSWNISCVVILVDVNEGLYKCCKS